MIKARPALGSSRAVIGFVQRAGCGVTGASVALPFAMPVVHMTFEDARAPPVAFSSGVATARTQDTTSPGATFVIALSFSGAAALAREAMPTGANRFTTLDDPFWTRLHARLAEDISFDARADIAEQALRERIAAGAFSSSRQLSAADAIVRDQWRGSVASLANDFGIEERTLRNRFRSELGWAPKQLLRVARFNRVLRALHPRSWAGGPAADVRLEFADDAHFHHDFTALAGFSPRAFIAAKRVSRDARLHNVSLVSLRQSTLPG